MRRPADSPSRPPPPSVPSGWLPVRPTRAEVSKSSSRVDGLGLTKGGLACTLVRGVRSNNTPDERLQSPRSSPRHRQLQQAQHHEGAAYTAAHAFAQNRSLRLASLTPRVVVEKTTVESRAPAPPPQQRDDGGNGNESMIPQTGVLSARSRGARLRQAHAPLIVPLHPAVRGFDDAVDASPRAESNQVAVTELFVASWMDRFERERRLYKSVALHAEIAFRELYRMTANVASPNDIVTAFACKIFDDMAEHFGPYAMIMRVLMSELRQAIYAPSTPEHPPLPYYAIVKNQKRILISLRTHKLRHQERNDFLRYEIDKVHETFLHFLDQSGLGLVRTIFHEWHSVAVVNKRNTRKYIEYFSAWFGSSAKALAPRLFLAWKRLYVETKLSRMRSHLASEQAKLALVQKQIEELTVQRNLAQLTSLAIRNDRKHADDTIQRLHRKIQSASAFLEDSQRREALVAHEAQLRVEAATFLPPLVLESLLRGFHCVGFLQPLHTEFASVSPETDEGQVKSQLLGRATCYQQQQASATDGTVLNQCVALLRSCSTQFKDDGSAALEIPVHECLNYVQGIKVRVEEDPTAHLLFLSEVKQTRLDHQSAPHKRASDGDTDSPNTTARSRESPLARHELVRQFNVALRHVRQQDEHYARHAKLFSSRLLEQSEISVVPHALITPQGEASPSPASPPPSTLAPQSIANARIVFSSIDTARVAGSTSPNCSLQGDQEKDSGDDPSTSPKSLDQLPLLQPDDLELSPRHTHAFLRLTLGQVVIEYGSLLFSPTDLTAFVRNDMLQKVMLRGLAGGKHTHTQNHTPLSTGTETEGNEGDGDGAGHSSDDDDDSDQHGEAAVGSLGVVTEHEKKGKMPPLLRKQTTQRRTRRKSSYRGLHAPIIHGIDRALSHLKVAYDAWNRITTQLIQADIVAARDGIVANDAALVPTDASGTSVAVVSPLAMPENSPTTPFVALRPRVYLHIEPLPTGPLMISAKDKDRSDARLAVLAGGRRRSTMALSSRAVDWSYDTAKVRRLTSSDTQQLVHAVHGLHGIMCSTSQQRAVDFSNAKQTLQSLRETQWLLASELASQFADSSLAVAPAATHDPGSLLAPEDDPRCHVFECVTFENEAIERLFSVEDHPEDELVRVQTLLERKKHIVRHAFYAKHRSGGSEVAATVPPYAATLDELWHTVKVLRLPRDVRVLPTLRDDELLLGTSYFHEHVFSPDDLAEVLLQLCNEQFLPHITPLSARVDFLITHHLPLAVQHQSAIRAIAHTHDVKRVLADHAHTLRTIFRRYCAKERDLLAAAAAKRRVAMAAASVSASASPMATAASNNAAHHIATSASSSSSAAAPPPQGITKFMRLADWHAFLADYKLLRAPRFTSEYATVVFCNVQEAESGLEDNLEMIFSEFTEAMVALSVVFYPDPFLRHAVRVHQFIRRYLPVSPDDHS